MNKRYMMRIGGMTVELTKAIATQELESIEREIRGLQLQLVKAPIGSIAEGNANIFLAGKKKEHAQLLKIMPNLS